MRLSDGASRKQRAQVLTCALEKNGPFINRRASLRLERQTQSKAELTLVILGAGDLQKASAAEVIIGVVDSGIVEMWAIEEIGRVHSELQSEALSDLEVAQKAEIQVHRTWSE